MFRSFKPSCTFDEVASQPVHVFAKVTVPVVLSQYYRNLGPAPTLNSSPESATARRSFDYYDEKMALQRSHRYMFDRQYSVCLRHPPSEVYIHKQPRLVRGCILMKCH